GGGTGIEGQFAKQFRFSPPSPAATRCQLWNTDNNPPTNNGTTNSNRPNIQLAFAMPCEGIPVAGTLPNETPLCTGSTALISATGTTAARGLTYQWEQSADGVTGWVPAAGTNNAGTYTTPPFSAPVFHRLIVTCT